MTEDRTFSTFVRRDDKFGAISQSYTLVTVSSTPPLPRPSLSLSLSPSPYPRHPPVFKQALSRLRLYGCCINSTSPHAACPAGQDLSDSGHIVTSLHAVVIQYSSPMMFSDINEKMNVQLTTRTIYNYYTSASLCPGANGCTPVSDRRKDYTTKRHPERGLSVGSAAIFVGTGV